MPRMCHPSLQMGTCWGELCSPALPFSAGLCQQRGGELRQDGLRRSPSFLLRFSIDLLHNTRANSELCSGAWAPSFASSGAASPTFSFSQSCLGPLPSLIRREVVCWAFLPQSTPRSGPALGFVFLRSEFHKQGVKVIKGARPLPPASGPPAATCTMQARQGGSLKHTAFRKPHRFSAQLPGGQQINSSAPRNFLPLKVGTAREEPRPPIL